MYVLCSLCFRFLLSLSAILLHTLELAQHKSWSIYRRRKMSVISGNGVLNEKLSIQKRHLFSIAKHTVIVTLVNFRRDGGANTIWTEKVSFWTEKVTANVGFALKKLTFALKTLGFSLKKYDLD